MGPPARALRSNKPCSSDHVSTMAPYGSCGRSIKERRPLGKVFFFFKKSLKLLTSAHNCVSSSLLKRAYTAAKNSNNLVYLNSHLPTQVLTPLIPRYLIVILTRFNVIKYFVQQLPKGEAHEGASGEPSLLSIAFHKGIHPITRLLISGQISRSCGSRLFI
jgi:hypothetical protein